jgi:hypothetical protein
MWITNRRAAPGRGSLDQVTGAIEKRKNNGMDQIRDEMLEGLGMGSASDGGQ